MSIHDCKIIELPKISDVRGDLTFIEGGKHIFFDIKRVYYLYDLPTVTSRGGHAHRDLYQLLICTSGSFNVSIDDGFEKKQIHMNRPDRGLYVVPGIWRELDNFSSNSACLVLASDFYKEEDYYRNYDDFIAEIKNKTI